MLNENNCQPKILYPKKNISFRIEGEIKTFPDEEQQKICTERNIEGSSSGRRTFQMEFQKPKKN